LKFTFPEFTFQKKTTFQQTNWALTTIAKLVVPLLSCPAYADQQAGWFNFS